MNGLFVASQDSDNEHHDQTGLDEVTGSGANPTSTSFTACTSQVSHLYEVFSAITAINSQALMIIRPSGIVVYSEYNHVSNVQLSIDPSLFSQYNYIVKDRNGMETSEVEDHQGELRLGIDISMVSDAFSSVASSIASKPKTAPSSTSTAATAAPDCVTCYITYDGDGSPLVVEFEDNLMSEKIEFLTFYTDFAYPYDSSEQSLTINHNQIQAELMLKSDVLSNLLGDLQQINTSELYIFMSNEQRTLGESGGYKPLKMVNSNIHFYDTQLNFISKGPIGHSKLIFPTEKTILEKLVLYELKTNDKMVQTNTALISCYTFSTFIKIFKAVKLSSKCKMLKDTNGVLSIQLLCKNSHLKTYTGTLITFNMLEVSNYMENEDFDQMSRDDVKSILDEERSEYHRISPEEYALIEKATGTKTIRKRQVPYFDEKRKRKTKTSEVEVPLFL